MMIKSLFAAMKSCLHNEKPVEKEYHVEELTIILPEEETRDNQLRIRELCNSSTNDHDDIQIHRPYNIKENKSVGTITELQVCDIDKNSEMKPSSLLSPKFLDDEHPSPQNLKSTVSFRNKTDCDISHSLSLPSKSQSEEAYGISAANNQMGFLDANRKSLLFTVKDCKDEMPENVFSMNNIVILDQEIAQAKSLTVEDEEGDLLCGDVLIINAGGLMTSLRRMRDGYSFFGTVEAYNNCLINDYIINYPMAQCKTRLFVIFYERATQKFYFRALNDPENETQPIIYIKLTNSFKIKKKIFFLIGGSIFYLDPIKNGSNDLKIAMYIPGSKKRSKSEYRFTQNESPVTIGRKSTCSIAIDSSLLSKVHCVIAYSNGWEISDGNESKFSTNGTWIWVNSRYEITEERTFVKIDQNVIKITMS